MKWFSFAFLAIFVSAATADQPTTDKTLVAFDEQGTVARTVDADFAAAHAVVDGLAGLGIDLEDVAVQLEDEGVASFAKAFEDVLQTLATRAEEFK